VGRRGRGGILAVACASLRLGLPAVVAVMATGAILMWISEEEKRVLAAMRPEGAGPVPAPELPSLPSPAPAPVPAGDASAIRVREWANAFPAPRRDRRERQVGRRAAGRRA
jgi:hypothetical protein